ncbi:MAG: tetratricopeptide repeat protein, partial [Terracidiphilus sp.]
MTRMVLSREVRRGEHGLLRFIPLAVILLLCAATCWTQDPTAPENDRQTALALEQQGRNTEAEIAWRAYLKVHPSSSEAYAHMGLLEARQEHYTDAIPFYRKALSLDSSIPGLRLNLGLAYFKAGEMKKALQEFSPLLG